LDMWAKGRGLRPSRQPTLDERARGSRHGLAKLNEHQVAEIRARYRARESNGVTQAQLAAEYNVCPALISNIVTGKHWKHVA
jgi:ribosome-binding protein aMBF1 (putative translation factor)